MKVALMRGVSLALLLFVAAPSVHADTPPNVWETARDPLIRDRYALHVNVRELISLESQLGSAALKGAALDRARGLLEDAGASTSPDMRLRFDLGEVYEALGRHEQAIAILSEALKAAPNHPAAEGVYMTLAYAYAKLDRPREERDAYEHYLARAVDARSRATALLNMAEAEMRLGHMEEAIAGYRDGIAAAALLPSSVSASQTGVLAVWGLAVALDRAGDPGGASVQARLAEEMDPGQMLINNRDYVFFVPEYERNWYLALGMAEQARQTSDAQARLTFWRKVEQLWAEYVERAGPTDRWFALAQAHLERVRAERAKVEKSLKRSGARLPPPVVDHTL